VKNVFAHFYGLEAFPTRCDKNLDNLLAEKKVLDIGNLFGNKILFNADVYKKRIRCSAETSLIEANHRGKKIGKRVHVLIVGLGLGVWKITHLQVSIYVTRSFIENRVLESHNGSVRQNRRSMKDLCLWHLIN
jgi:hypothetical protein